MSVSEPKDRGTTPVDRHPLSSDGVVDRTKRAEIERVNAQDLRAITPEEIQILAATGC
jgi:hypothetical protein